MDALLGDKYDMILAPLIGEHIKIGDRLIKSTCLEDAFIFVKCMAKISPDYYQTALKILSGNAVSPYNMFVMRNDLFKQFANWQFGVLSEAEKYVKPSGYSRMRRVYGYMSEMMLTTFAVHNNLRVLNMPIVSIFGDDGELVLGENPRGWLKRMIIKYIVTRGAFTFMDEKAIAAGLKNDGIVLG